MVSRNDTMSILNRPRKQVHMISEQPDCQGSLTLIATSTMGLEALVAREIAQLGLEPRNSSDGTGRTRFTGSVRDMARANIHLRTAGKIQIELANFELTDDFDALFDAAEAVPWEAWMPVDAAVLVEGRSVRSTITSVPALQRTVKKAIVNRLTKAYHVRRLEECGPAYTVEISVLKDKAVLTLDTTGRGLHRRGYRLMNVAVPLRETLASALIQLSVWTPDRPLIDPFCASGTIPIEAAMLARRIAPGLKREFAAQAWPVIDAAVWQEVREEAQAAILPSLDMKIIGSDIDAQALEYARYHARIAGVDGDIVFEQRDFKDLADSRSYGCIICNPPYGDREGEHEQYRPLYDSMPGVLSGLPTWSHYIYTSWNDFERRIGQEATRRRKLFNGRIECTYFQFLGPRPPRPGQVPPEPTDRPVPSPDHPEYTEHSEPSQNEPSHKTGPEPGTPDRLVLKKNGDAESLPAEDIPTKNATTQNDVAQNDVAPEVVPEDGVDEEIMNSVGAVLVPAAAAPVVPVFARLDDYALYQETEFGRCLQNRARHLRRFPKRGITSYRLYDRDFPEVPLAIDLFEGKWLHLAEYERPDDRTVPLHRMWLDRMVAKAGETLGIEPENVFLKRRVRQRGESQYEKLAESHRIVTAHEGGLKFLCNMTDYLDVGLFLDHRITRDLVRKEASGKRFLNLFCYTGSFTCYAADGGAASTVSVDLSPTYLDWTADNMAENGFRCQGNRGAHRLVKADVVRFLESLPPATRVGQSALNERSESSLYYGIGHSDFDLCVCDPPTFSNSKSTRQDWEVQRGHVPLLRLLATRMTQGGVVYFSNNFRRFKLDEEALGDLYTIRDITARTVPEEYRNKRIHRCWRLVVK